MRPKAITPKESPKPVGPYSHAVRIGDMLFTSGQIPLDKSGKLVEGGIAAQTTQALENVKMILASEGLDMSNVVKTTVYMTNLGEFSAMNDVYALYFQEPFPARSTIQAAALPRSAQVEIEIIACYTTP